MISANLLTGKKNTQKTEQNYNQKT